MCGSNTGGEPAKWRGSDISIVHLSTLMKPIIHCAPYQLYLMKPHGAWQTIMKQTVRTFKTLHKRVQQKRC